MASDFRISTFINVTGEFSHNETTTTVSDVYVVGEIPWNVRLVGTLVGLVLMLTCIPGNILLMIASLMKPLDKNIERIKTNFACQLVFSLAVTDTYFLIVRGFLSVYTYMKGTWTFGPAACALLFATRRVCHTSALEHIVAISALRYLAVVHGKIIAPRWFITVTVMTVIYAIPIVLTFIFIPDRLVFLPQTAICVSFATATKKQENPAVKKIAAVLFVVAFGLVLCYLHIYIRVRRSRATIHSLQTNADDDDERMNVVFIQREIKLVRTIACVFFSYILTYPVTSVFLVIDRDVEWPYMVHYLCVVSDNLVHSLNWIIYGVTNDWIRKRYRQIISGQMCRERKRQTRVGPVENHIDTAAPPDPKLPVPVKLYPSVWVTSSSTRSTNLTQVRHKKWVRPNSVFEIRPVRRTMFG